MWELRHCWLEPSSAVGFVNPACFRLIPGWGVQCIWIACNCIAQVDSHCWLSCKETLEGVLLIILKPSPSLAVRVVAEPLPVLPRIPTPPPVKGAGHCWLQGHNKQAWEQLVSHCWLDYKVNKAQEAERRELQKLDSLQQAYYSARPWARPKRSGQRLSSSKKN